MAEKQGDCSVGGNLPRWVEHLRLLAAPVVSGVDLLAQWQAATGHPHSSAAAFLAWRLASRRRGPQPGLAEAVARERLQPARDDAALWWGLLDGAAGLIDRWIDLAGSGALFRQDLYQTIEVWTETELSALHALWHAARRSRPELASRVSSAVSWHLQHTQPDNATNRPWAAHVFLLHGSAESRHFAETLVSNCIVLNGRPDPLSAQILLDAAEALESTLIAQ